MRFVLMALACDGEAAALDSYEQELVRAGVLLAAEPLEAAGTGARIRFEGDDRILSRIPSGAQPADDAVTAIWTLHTAGEDEALEWARRLPLTRGTVEVRRVAGDASR
jgi:hypothetical protein